MRRGLRLAHGSAVCCLHADRHSSPCQAPTHAGHRPALPRRPGARCHAGPAPQPSSLSAAQGGSKTYYHVKDIAYLLHEPLLKKARELAAHEKKVRRARAKRNRELAARLAAARPSYRLDHLVRER